MRRFPVQAWLQLLSCRTGMKQILRLLIFLKNCLQGRKPGSVHVEITELHYREAALGVSGRRNPFTNVYPMASGCREPHGEDTAQCGSPKPAGRGVKLASDHKPIIGRLVFFFLTPFILQLKVLLSPRYEFSAFSVVKQHSVLHRQQTQNEQSYSWIIYSEF